MLIVLEGPDKAGKSTLAQELHTVLPKAVLIKAVKRGRSGNLLATKIYTEIFELNRDKLFLCDRLNIFSERVYAPIIEQKTIVYTDDQITRVENRLNQIGTVLVHVTASPDEIRRRYERMGGDDYVPEVNIDDVVSLYYTMVRSSRVPHVTIDTSTGTVRDNVNRTFELIEEVRDQCKLRL